MQKTSQDYAKKCNQCHRYAPNIHQLEGVLNPLSSPWPFARWGLVIVGPFPRAICNRRWLLIGTDYFTKWIEAETLANIRDVDAKRFIWKNIVTRFGVPHTLISDNGLQFDSKAFRRSTDETPFSMTYKMEAVIPLESGFPTLKSEQYSVEGNHRMFLDNLNTVEEKREVASVKMANYQQKLKQTYDKGVKLRPLMPGDLVLRKVVGTVKNPAWGKLGPN
ncbi:uncharacterized protein LOC142606279 [Castanea sativa]|uniref:uncharacterized protein LOC142606279 n=1 Tax=Castanea sativa TaxID=21020 RepID=UPI003F64DA48